MWAENLFRIFDMDHAEVIPSIDLVRDRVHPEDRWRFDAAIEAARSTGELPPIELRITWPDGSIRHLRVVGAVDDTETGVPGTLVGGVQDVTEQRRAEYELAARLAVSEALRRWSSLGEGTERLLPVLLEALDVAAGVLWLPEVDVLAPRLFASAPSTSTPELEKATWELRLASGLCLAGEAWRRQRPVALAGLPAGHRFVRREEAEHDGIRSAVAIPAVLGEETLAVIELFAMDSTKLTSSLTRLMACVGYELGAFLDLRRGELAAPALSPRELEIIQLAAQGLSTPEIAQRLVVATSTVKTHFAHIYEKLGVSDRAAAVAQAFRQRLIA